MKTTITIPQDVADSIKTFQDFVEAFGVKIETVKVDGRNDATDFGKGASHYVCVLQDDVHTGHVLTYYSMGRAHKYPPKAADVLQSLALDSSCSEESFEDWCANFGDDTDSLKAHKTWEACRKVNRDLVEWLSQGDFEILARCEEE